MGKTNNAHNISDNASAILAQTKTIVLKELHNVEAKVYLFGSWVKNRQRTTSDIDIAIEHRGAVTAATLARIREVLEESNVPYRVDVVDLTKSGAGLADKVKREGLLWKDYGKD